MDLSNALDSALRSRYGLVEVRTPITQKRGLSAYMNRLENHYARKGDTPPQKAARAAEAVGVTPRTWKTWRKGTPPRPASLAKVQQTFKDQIARPALRRSTRRNGVPDMVHVTAVIRWEGYYNPQRYRTVKFGPSGIKSALRATIKAWFDAGRDAAAQVFQLAISDANDVANETDGTPGVLFEGDNVKIEFP